jgi:AAA15 family ATPase/GTPase
LERIAQEIVFDSFELETDKVKVAIINSLDTKVLSTKIKYSTLETEFEEFEFKRPDRSLRINAANQIISNNSGETCFFPTFRLIEGGFSTTNLRSRWQKSTDSEFAEIKTTSRASYSNSLQHSMLELSDKISVGSHRFIASVSTVDINRLLTTKYAEISEQSNKKLMELSNYILFQVNMSNSNEEIHNNSITVDDIIKRAKIVTNASESLLRPFTVLSQLIGKIFLNKGIDIGPITLGETAEAIASDMLSAGEKQMLSFLSYNAFASNSSIFIDEPEMSLHVDWQRILFPTLLAQSTGNQFIVATHSPFIYSKYADKELILADRGDDDADT